MLTPIQLGHRMVCPHGSRSRCPLTAYPLSYDPVTLPPTQYKLSKDLSTESLVVLQNLKERLKDLHVCVNLGILQMFS